MKASSSGYRWVKPFFVVQFRPANGTDQPRIGYTVTKKQGNAVVRNRIKRRLREMVRLHLAEMLRPGCDYVFIGRTASLNTPFAKVELELRGAIVRLHKNYDRDQAKQQAGAS